MSRKLHNESEDAIQDYQNPIDLFADSAEQEDLAVTHSPRALRTELYKHQKQALTFMLLREKGWALKSEQRKDIWKAETDATGRRVFKNTISGQKQVKPPEDFRGGLLIDAPGLGKSLSIISLILSTKANSGWKGPADAPLAATLLIAPKTLIQTWKDELQRHLKSTDDLRFCVYYGKDRTKLLKELHRHDLVITTYSVVRLDWKASSAEPENRSTLYSVKWRRIVLDEAHIIREPTKSFARSVCALKAECRWGVTGTPIQNRLTDLYSLFKFLRCTPFDDVSVFNAHVTKNWRARSDPNSVAKLKTLVNCLSLRRPKTTVTLPARRDTAVPLEFNEQERKHYDKVKTSTKHKLASVCHENRSVTLMNALQWVNELRHICTMGIKDRGAIQTLEEKARSKPAWNQAAAQTRFDIFDEAGLARCSECSQDLASSLSSETDVEHVEEPRMEEFLDLLCSSCFLARSGARNFVKEVRAPYSATVVDANKVLSSVVFSGWTTTFDIIQPQLIDKGIRCVRLDGTSSASHRSRVIHAFRMNTDISVLLATITCGGVGLDLTAASRAYIMEPQWNPMSESQALDRIHRLGQQKEVETIRYVMRESYEEQVLKLQKRKQELADLTLSGGLIRKADLTEGRLRYLKELVG
ncbi:hypothetical protein MMC30_009254 [Trapelia coarctata]|nr:hypothetical protein [Trapelia coarctata]